MGTDYLASHAGLAIWLAVMQLVGGALCVAAVLPSSTSRTLAMAYAVGIGLLMNFQAHFVSVTLLHQSPAFGLALGLLVYGTGVVLLVRYYGRLRSSASRADVLTADSKLLAAPLVAGQWLAVLAALLGAAVLAPHLLAEIPGVFGEWDAVVSWNNWATDWSIGTSPAITFGYPQLLPTALASLYVWLGTTQVEPVARIFLLVFPLSVCLLYLDGYHRWQNTGFLYGLALWLMMLAVLVPGMATSGYADIPVAFGVSLTGYLLLQAVAGKLAVVPAVWLAATSAAIALLTKQPGGVACLLWLGLVVWPGPLRKQIASHRLRHIGGAAMLFLALAAPWYLHYAYQLWQGRDYSNIAYLTSSIHGSATLIERITRALQVPLAQLLAPVGGPGIAGPVMTLLLVVACARPLGRWLTLGFVLPYTLLWAALFSYDIRNLVLVMPALALALGLGLSVICDAIMRYMPDWRVPWLPLSALRTNQPCTKNAALTICLLTGMTGALWPTPVSELAELHRRLQRQSIDPVWNRHLLDYAREPGFRGKVITSYAPMAMIDDLRQNMLPLRASPVGSPELLAAIRSGRPWCEIQSLAPQLASVRYILFHTFLMQSVIDDGLRDGTLKLVLAREPMRFVKINCPTP